MDNKKMQTIKLIIAIFVVIVVATIVTVRILKYQKEGEKNMPFNLSKIIIVSTAIKDDTQSAENQDQNASIWNFNVIQNNDIYISIENNKNNTKNNEKIKSIVIENIQILQNPSIGTVKAYMPNSIDGEKYKYTDEYIVSQSLTYRGAEENNFKTLQISKNGGNIGISFANKEIGTYSSGEDTEITYNGTMLSKLGITNENVKSKVAFDLIIELDDGKKYSGRVELDLSCEGLVETGTSQTEITDFSNIIFKRI
ncbi:MAG: hypothetical protein J6A89_03345 [Clostridia bacterium]|nr:hypothetical protein [Clostridia bacterium]